MNIHCLRLFSFVYLPYCLGEFPAKKLSCAVRRLRGDTGPSGSGLFKLSA